MTAKKRAQSGKFGYLVCACVCLSILFWNNTFRNAIFETWMVSCTQILDLKHVVYAKYQADKVM